MMMGDVYLGYLFNKFLAHQEKEFYLLVTQDKKSKKTLDIIGLYRTEEDCKKYYNNYILKELDENVGIIYFTKDEMEELVLSHKHQDDYDLIKYLNFSENTKVKIISK